ncbi:Translocon-associated protein subunit delta [Trichinella pseudospiralis]|uniref:Translocon-associated protein subunit delta n=1 Tax=Trichinella pseudospiralis TaxID=6337 RepID=A0A0V1EJY8_TRIPS|nr:Translocon-associated protein subunit delta [Trichinella pseudospiralis]
MLHKHLPTDTCRNPTLVKHSGYSSTDSFFHAKTAIVIEFSVNCDHPVKEYPLYWEYEGDVHLAAQLPTGLHYQITFVNDHKKIARGQYDIRIFDEEGFAALRKAMRSKVDTNEAVKPIFTVSYYHPGSSGEPWIASQTIVLAASAIVLYYAYTWRTKFDRNFNNSFYHLWVNISKD